MGRSMANRWDGLGAVLLRTAGMHSPACMMRLAGCAGFRLVPVAGRVCVSLVGSDILFDAMLPNREQHRAVALALAEAMLRRESLPVHERSIEDVARELLLPPDEFERDARECDFDLEALERLHLHVPLRWLADAVEALQSESAKVVYLHHQR